MLYVEEEVGNNRRSLRKYIERETKKFPKHRMICCSAFLLLCGPTKRRGNKFALKTKVLCMKNGRDGGSARALALAFVS